jgi:hypothetical protein
MMVIAIKTDDDLLDEAIPLRRRRKDPFGMDDMEMDEDEVVKLS